MMLVPRKVQRFNEKKNRLKKDLVVSTDVLKAFHRKRKYISVVLLQSARGRTIEIQIATSCEIEFSKIYSYSNIFV